MRLVVILVVFTIYNIWLFLVSSWPALTLLLLMSEFIILINHRAASWRMQGKFLLFISFIFLCNLFFCSLEMTILISLRLLLALLATYLLLIYLSPTEIAEGIAKLCTPLKLFRVDTAQLELIIAIALTYVSLLAHTARNIQTALLLKGFRFNFWNLFTRPQIFLSTYLENLFDTIDTAEVALLLKGYGVSQ